MPHYVGYCHTNLRRVGIIPLLAQANWFLTPLNEAIEVGIAFFNEFRGISV
jgi:hypothetical protein